MARVNLYDWADILQYGVTNMGHNWNVLHDLMTKCEFPPMYEARTREYYLSDIESNQYGMPKEVCEVIIAFMNNEGITEMVVE